MQGEADAAAEEEESSDEETSDSSSSSSSDDESIAPAPAGRQAGQRGQEVGVSLQVSPTCLEAHQWPKRRLPQQHHVVLQSRAMGGGEWHQVHQEQITARLRCVPGKAHAVFLQVDAGGRVKLQLGVGAPRSAEDEVEELRAELDRMEHGGEDADDAHMYARCSPCALQIRPTTANCFSPSCEACIKAE